MNNGRIWTTNDYNPTDQLEWVVYCLFGEGWRFVANLTSNKNF